MLLNDAQMSAMEIGLRNCLGAGAATTNLLVLLNAVNRTGPPVGPLPDEAPQEHADLITDDVEPE